MNILFLINYAGNAGTEKYVKLLADECQKRGDRCFLAYHIYGPLCDELRAKKVELFPLPMKHPFDLSAAKRLADFCKKNQIDIIHAQYARENAIAVLSRLFYRKPKVFMTVHLTIEPPVLWRRFIYRMLTPLNEKIICVCNRCKEIYKNCGVKEKKLQVIFNGIDSPGQLEGSRTLEKEFGITDDTFVIITAARFSPEKGLPFLIDAMARLKEICRWKFKLLLAGDGEQKDEVRDKVDALELNEQVLFLGYRKDMDILLPQAHVYVNSSSGSEALSFSILEAMSYGLPIVATNIGGNPDLINDETDCGFLVESGDAEAMAEKLDLLMNDRSLYDRFSLHARRAITERFNQQAMLDTTYCAYREALGESK